MAKKNKQKSNAGVAVVAVVVIIMIALVSLASYFITQQTSLSGVSVLSVDEPNVRSNNEDLSKLNWLITTKLGGGDRITFTMSPEYFDQQTGLATEKKFTATADSVDEVLKYQILLQNDFVIWDYHITGMLEESDPCPENTLYDVPFERLLFSDPHFCIVRNFEGRYGKLSNPTRTFEADLSISNGDETIKKTISSSDSSVAFKSGNDLVATASWSGSLITGNPDPVVPEIGVLTAAGSNRWKFITRTNFNSYQNAQDSFDKFLNTDIFSGIADWYGFSAIRNEIEQEMQYLDGQRRLRVENYISLDNDLSLINPTSTSTGRLDFDSDVQLTQPVVTWWIRADWLGIERLVGSPKILSVDSNEFGKDEQGQIRIRVRNDGADATFKASLQNCNNFDQQFVGNEQSFSSGETDYMVIFIDPGSVNSDLSESCTVRVYDTNYPEQQDVASVGLTYKATRVCTANTYSVEGDDIFKCDSEGLSKSIVLSCTGDSTATYTGSGNFGGYECVVEDDGTPTPTDDGDGDTAACFIGGINIFGNNFGGTEVPDFFCTYDITLTKILATLLGVFTVLVVGTMVQLKNNSLKLGVPVPLIWVLALISGILVGFVFVTLWWVALLLLFVFFLLYLILGGVLR